MLLIFFSCLARDSVGGVGILPDRFIGGDVGGGALGSIPLKGTIENFPFVVYKGNYMCQCLILAL